MPAPRKGELFFKPKAGVSYEAEHRSQNGDMLPRARELRREMTPQERKLWYQFLRRYPVKIYKQRIIESFIADFYCSRAQLVIELDGAQHTTEQGLLYDRERAASFRSTAWMFFVFPIMKWIFSLKPSVKKSIRRFNLAFEAALPGFAQPPPPGRGGGGATGRGWSCFYFFLTLSPSPIHIEEGFMFCCYVFF